MKNKTIRSLLSYQGNKFDFISSLKDLMPDCDVFHDVFGGSGTVSLNMGDKAKVVRYNEIDPKIFYLLNNLKKAENAQQISYGMDYYIEEFNLHKYPQRPKSIKNKEAYYKFMENYNEYPTNFKLWVLSKHSFSSLIRFNKKGEFNMTWGNRSFSQSTSRDLKISAWLDHFKDVRMSKLSYVKYLHRTAYKEKYRLNRFHIFYFDPPYLASGDNVYANEWSINEEEKLLRHLNRMLNSNIKFILSNVLEHRSHKNEILSEWIKSRKDRLLVVFPNKNKKGEKYTLNRAVDKRNNKTVEVIVTNLCTEI
jgi:DNA adenine methylase Dam